MGLWDYGIMGRQLGCARKGQPGVFTRQWTRAQVTMDCTTYQANITAK